MSRSQVRLNLSLRFVIRSATAALLATSGIVALQAQQVDHYSPQSLVEEAGGLKAKAPANHGAASETLQKYGVDYTMLSYRTQDGGGELHANFADIFVVVEGEATLLTGGELEHQETSAPGEFRGTAVLHGSSTHLGKGDVVHIPPGTPHQLLIAKGNTFLYFVIKVKEKE
jgi:mannose-6-phosphate isomerase-like protein (cupin superfamily)